VCVFAFAVRTSKGRVSHVIPHDTSGTSIGAERSRPNNLVDKVVRRDFPCRALLRPRIVVAKGIKEGVDDPSNQDRVVRNDHVSTCNGGNPDALPATVKASKDTDVTGLVVLTETNLENQQRNSNQKESQEVGDKEGPSTVVSRECSCREAMKSLEQASAIVDR
jgi:hypothetical protein